VAELSRSIATNTLGLYFHGDRIVLDPREFFTLGEPGQTHEDPEFRRLAGNTLTPIHELFHAVQFAYLPSGVFHQWIVEGTADAALKAYGDHEDPDVAAPITGRRFDRPLHRPDPAHEAYGTWWFWRELGRKLGSEHDLAYLHRLFQEDLVSGEGIPGLDRFLAHRGGLHQVFPRILRNAARLDAPELFGGALSWRPAASSGTDVLEDTLDLEVQQIAGRLVDLRFRPPGPGVYQVAVGVVGDHPDIHLVADGEDMLGEAWGASRNRFRFVAEGPGETRFQLLVVNVAEEARTSQAKQVSLEVLAAPLACPWPVDGAGAAIEALKTASRSASTGPVGSLCMQLSGPALGGGSLSFQAVRPIERGTASEDPQYLHSRTGGAATTLNARGPGGRTAIMIVAPGNVAAGTYRSVERGGGSEIGLIADLPGQRIAIAAEDRHLVPAELTVTRAQSLANGWILAGSFSGLTCCFGPELEPRLLQGRFHLVHTCGKGQILAPGGGACIRDRR